MLQKTYDARQVEDKIYAFWEQHKLFKPQVHADAEQSFSIVIPPPNVTGTLHMGHALDNTLQDILIRWHRMLGHKTLWMPGTDHAGIATQNVVERNLREQGKTKFDLGREAFLEEVWRWALARKGDIIGQFKRLGISPDWDRERFTLDEGCSKAVRTAFATLYQQGLIYKGTYIVNWCPRCTSAISDIETDYVEEDSHLWQIRYPLADGSADLVVATTRPETMFGDVAVAVHPQDERYQNLIGQTIQLPLANVPIPVVADDYVDRDFGTGVLKITPAHDPNDFDVASRHKLEPITIMNEDGTLKALDRVPTALQGLERFEARKQTEALLQQHGFLVDKQPHHHSVGHCQRCSTTIEPLLSKQWFVRCKPIAKKALARLDARELQFIPQRWEKVYRDWMTNIRDWCISRQLWWGHQIPAWACQQCAEFTVSVETPIQCEHCQSTDIVQETDVLDTWFSSGLWPFSTMGWPEQTTDFNTFYPTQVLVTGFDIIFFWVARMVLFGEAITQQSPFHTVYVHGLIRDEKGQKMSKSKGNTIDPVEVIDEYGCDALRFSLTSMVTGGQDIKLSKESFDKGRLFANKLWNASRFVLMNLEGLDDQPIDEAALTDMDKYILGRLSITTRLAKAGLERFSFADTANMLYRFVWNDFCDWYVEFAKKQLRDEQTKANTQRVLRKALDDSLRLLHPIMPYITEEIWQQLPHNQEIGIIVSRYPTDIAHYIYDDTAVLMDRLFELITSVREARQSSGVAHHQSTEVMLEITDNELRDFVARNQDVILHFVKIKTLTIVDSLSSPPANSAVAVVGSSRVFVDLTGTIDIEAERTRQLKKRETLQKEHDQLSQRLNNKGFVDRAPQAVVEKDRQRQQELQQQLEAIEAQLSALV